MRSTSSDRMKGTASGPSNRGSAKSGHTPKPKAVFAPGHENASRSAACPPMAVSSEDENTTRAPALARWASTPLGSARSAGLMMKKPGQPKSSQRPTSPSATMDSSSAIGTGKSEARPRSVSSAPFDEGATGCSTNSTGRSDARESQSDALRRFQAPFASSRILEPVGRAAKRSSRIAISSSAAPTPTFHLKTLNPISAFAGAASSAALPEGRRAATPRLPWSGTTSGVPSAQDKALKRAGWVPFSWPMACSVASPPRVLQAASSSSTDSRPNPGTGAA